MVATRTHICMCWQRGTDCRCSSPHSQWHCLVGHRRSTLFVRHCDGEPALDVPRCQTRRNISPKSQRSSLSYFFSIYSVLVTALVKLFFAYEFEVSILYIAINHSFKDLFFRVHTFPFRILQNAFSSYLCMYLLSKSL